MSQDTQIKQIEVDITIEDLAALTDMLLNGLRR